MGRILALDVGRKRTGVAVTDPLRIIATPLTTLSTHKVVAFLQDYFEKETVDCMVVGYPVTLRNTPSEANCYIEPLLKQIRKAFPTLEIMRYDERFTSSLAFQAMIDGGLGKEARQDKAMVDKISASLILQSYMQHEELKKRG